MLGMSQRVNSFVYRYGWVRKFRKVRTLWLVTLGPSVTYCCSTSVVKWAAIVLHVARVQ